jgi:hypothetical protein
MSQRDRKIAAIRALEILDSRGNPTVRVYVELECGIIASASVPSGASTGENEAVELCDGDISRYGGKGVREAVAAVNDVIAPSLRGVDAMRQTEIDRPLIELDGNTQQSQARSQRDSRRVDGGSKGGRGCDRIATLCLPWRTRRAAPADADADDERLERRQARRQQRRFPGIHDRADRGFSLLGSPALRRRYVPSTAALVMPVLSA